MKKNFKKLILPASILVASQAIALGLGNLQVDSVLEETLKGEIPLMLDGSENLDSLKVSLASAADYKRVGLDKSYVPSNIHVSIDDNNDGKYIKISSKGPVTEPIVSLLVSVDWSNGHLLREYTLLLDPAAYTVQSQDNYTAPVQTQTYKQPEPLETTVETETTDTTALEETTTEVETQDTQDTVETTTTYAEPDTTVSYASDQVVVAAGDTLWRIASNNSNGYTPQQMMVAIFNNNPSAFNNGDMNQLKKGAVLDIPSAEQVESIGYSEALAEVKSQTQNWSSLQTEDNSDLYETDSESSTADESSTDYGIEIVPPKDADEASDSTATAGTSDSDDTTEELNRTQEELANAELEKQELAEKVKDLEEIVKDQSDALDVQDDDLADLQNSLTDEVVDEVTEVADDLTAEATDELTDNLTDTELTDTEATDSETNDDETTESEVTDDDLTDVASDDTETSDNSEVWDDEETDSENTETTDTSDDAEDDLTITNVDETDEASTETSQEVEQHQPPLDLSRKPQSFMDKVMAYKTEGLIGLGVLLLGLFGFLFMRRKGEAVDAGDFLDSITTTADDAESAVSAESEDLAESIEETLDEAEDTLEDVADDVTEDITLADEVEEAVSDSVTELNLTNLDDDFDDLEDSIEETVDEAVEDIEDIAGDVSDDFDLDDAFNLDDEPEVAVMDEPVEEDDGDFDLDDLDDFDDLDTLEAESDTEEEVDELGDIEYDTAGLQDAISGLKKDTTQEVEDLTQSVAEVDTAIDSEVDELVESFDDELVETLDEAEDVSLDFDLDDFSLDDDSQDVDSFASEIDAIVDTVEHDSRDVEEKLEEQGFDLDETDSTDTDVALEEEFDLGFDLDEGGDDAIDTKLDLAKAYFEMGDVDGAKQMVVEIIEEGNDDQIAKATELKNEIEGS